MEKNEISFRKNKVLIMSVIVGAVLSLFALSSSAGAVNYDSFNKGCMVFINKVNPSNVMNAEWIPCYESMPNDAPRVGSEASSILFSVKSYKKNVRTGYDIGNVSGMKVNKYGYKYGSIYKDNKVGYRIGARNEITNKISSAKKAKYSNKSKSASVVKYIYVQKPSVVYYPIQRSATYFIKISTKPQVVYVTAKTNKTVLPTHSKAKIIKDVIYANKPKANNVIVKGSGKKNVKVYSNKNNKNVVAYQQKVVREINVQYKYTEKTSTITTFYYIK